MSPEDDAAEMRRQYEYAKPETHMLVNGVLHLRCGKCKVRPVPHDHSFVQLCDECLEAAIAR